MRFRPIRAALSFAPGRFIGAQKLTIANGVGEVTLNWVASPGVGDMTYTVEELVAGAWTALDTTTALTWTAAASVGAHTYRITTTRGGGHPGAASNTRTGWSMQLRTATFAESGTWVPTGAPVSSVNVWVCGEGGRRPAASGTQSGYGGGGGVIHAAAYPVTGPVPVVFTPRVEGVQFHGGSVAFGTLVAGGGGDGGDSVFTLGSLNRNGSDGTDTGGSGGGAGVCAAWQDAVGGTGVSGGYDGGSRPGGSFPDGHLYAEPSGGGGAAGAGGAGPTRADGVMTGNGGTPGPGIESPIGLMGQGGGYPSVTFGYGHGGGHSGGSWGAQGVVYVEWYS